MKSLWIIGLLVLVGCATDVQKNLHDGDYITILQATPTRYNIEWSRQGAITSANGGLPRVEFMRELSVDKYVLDALSTNDLTQSKYYIVKKGKQEPFTLYRVITLDSNKIEIQPVN